MNKLLNKKWLRILFAYFVSVGVVSTLITIIMFSGFEKSILLSLMKVSSVTLLVINIVGAFLFKQGLSLFELWVRRCVIMMVSITTVIVSGLLFGVAQVDNYPYALVSSVCILPSVIFYFIADRVEKNVLARINKKLVEHREKSEENEI